VTPAAARRGPRAAALLAVLSAAVLAVAGVAWAAPADEKAGVDQRLERARDRLASRHRQVLEAVPVRQPAALPAIAATAGIGLLATQSALSYLAERGFVAEATGGWRLEQAADSEVPEP